MSKRPTRHVGLFPADRDDLLRKAHALWRATCATMAYMKTPSDDYKAAQTLAFGLVDFAKRISGGQADFAAGLASTRATGPQSWFKTAGDYEAAVDEAIEV